MLITCPWCGTHYASFQPNCKNCGGALQPGRAEQAPAGFEQESLPLPPAPPRPIAGSYAWKLLVSDGFAIAAGVFTLLGGIFSLVGIVLTLGIITAFVGIPFALLGLFFLGAGGAVLYWRYQSAQKIVRVLRDGQATEGRILNVEENLAVRVNQRHPWTISYSFQANGRSYTGNITTLKPPGQQLQPQRPACVLYLPEAPETNSLYPHP